MVLLILANLNILGVGEYSRRYYVLVTYGIIFVLGLVGNITSIIIYVVRLRPWKSSGIIMVNLALADLLYVQNWIMGDIMCPIVCFSYHFNLSNFNLYGSILFLTCLSEFHYVVVVHPLRAAQVQRESWAVIDCSAVWFISMLEITTMVYMTTVEKTENVIYVCIIFI
uniref:Oxoglutarate (alpha-ketoglutarate) receptor 1b n=1 Tax=Hucho hucho TaxID=62062 RepID=A0A4W5P1C3_9TELE